MDRKKTKLEVNEIFPKWKKASIKLYTMLATVFNSNKPSHLLLVGFIILFLQFLTGVVILFLTQS